MNHHKFVFWETGPIYYGLIFFRVDIFFIFFFYSEFWVHMVASIPRSFWPFLINQLQTFKRCQCLAIYPRLVRYCSISARTGDIHALNLRVMDVKNDFFFAVNIFLSRVSFFLSNTIYISCRLLYTRVLHYSDLLHVIVVYAHHEPYCS